MFARPIWWYRQTYFGRKINDIVFSIVFYDYLSFLFPGPLWSFCFCLVITRCPLGFLQKRLMPFLCWNLTSCKFLSLLNKIKCCRGLLILHKLLLLVIKPLQYCTVQNASTVLIILKISTYIKILGGGFYVKPDLYKP